MCDMLMNCDMCCERKGQEAVSMRKMGRGDFAWVGGEPVQGNGHPCSCMKEGLY